MCYAQEFPATVEEWMESNKIVDTEHIYTNGSEMVPIFRMRQWFQHVATQKEPHWIPVTERLPEEDEEVNVTILDDNGDTPFRYVTTAWYYKGIWVADNERAFGVVAWLPLPEPYREVTK